MQHFGPPVTERGKDEGEKGEDEEAKQTGRTKVRTKKENRIKEDGKRRERKSKGEDDGEEREWEDKRVNG